MEFPTPYWYLLAGGALVSTPETPPGGGQRQAFCGAREGYGDLGALLPPWALGEEFESEMGVRRQDVELSWAPGEALIPMQGWVTQGQ